jgi:hypothetical protein
MRRKADAKPKSRSQRKTAVPPRTEDAATKADTAAPEGKTMYDESQSQPNQAQTVTQAGTTPVPVEASHPAGETTTALTAQEVDAAAAAEVELERAKRIERERKVPYVPPEMPAGLSPNEKVTLFAAGITGTVPVPADPAPPAE